MLGNLLVFEGPKKINAYAALLKSNIGLLWTARSILIAAVVLHIYAAYQLARTSQKSQPVGYKRWRAVGSDFGSRTMRSAAMSLFVSKREPLHVRRVVWPRAAIKSRIKMRSVSRATESFTESLYVGTSLR